MNNKIKDIEIFLENLENGNKESYPGDLIIAIDRMNYLLNYIEQLEDKVSILKDELNIDE